LFSDIAYALGTISTTTAILRTKSGRFGITNATALDFIDENSVVSILDAFAGIKTYEVDERLAKKFINGIKIAAEEIEINDNSEFFISFAGQIIGFYRRLNDIIEPIVYLYEVNNG